MRRWILQRDGARVAIDNEGGLGIGRASLLEQLGELADRAGVEVRRGHEFTIDQAESADLVVAADGVSSGARERLAGHLGVHLDPVPLPYLWCGAAIETDGMLLATTKTPDGIFTAHVMPYAQGKVTFQVDTELAVPGLAGSLLDRDDVAAAFGHLRFLSLAGASVSGELFAKLSALGLNVLQHLGMGEGICLAMPIDSPREMRATTVGYPLSELDEVRIVDPETGVEVSIGGTGELMARGPYTIRGYYDAAELNVDAFSQDGFYKTGDLAKVVPIGKNLCYRHVGRLKDLINRGGEKINAEEVELVLAGHPGIRAVALVAMPNERLGERTCAYVVPSGPDSIDLANIRAFLASRDVAKYKWPERLELVDRFPTTLLGKTSKAALRDEIEARLRGEAADAHR